MVVPLFFVPKSDGSMRLVYDARELNKRLENKILLLPEFEDGIDISVY